MAEPRRVTALDARERELADAGARAIPLGSQVSIRADEDAASALGLPIDPNTWSAVDRGEALWLGPDEWLVVSETEPADTIVDDARRRLAGRHHSVMDVSANRVVIELTRPRRFELLDAGCGIDLHPRAWLEGMCAQTLLANVAVLLQERNDATRVFVRPSFAGHLVTWLTHVGTDLDEG
jgi:sarcosine oxidase subunit gamma